MDGTPTVLNEPPPPFQNPRQTIDFSPLEFVLGLIAVITIPALIYTFFFAIKCPPNPFRRPRRSSATLAGAPGIIAVSEGLKGVASDIKYRKDEQVKGVGSECPVCLCAFVEGEEVRQLSVCQHSFHATCIDLWLNSHSNCPVCRASVAVVRRPNPPIRTRDSDLHQGLPDASSLV